MKDQYLPELLCPAGSVEALCAAIDGGADAVYMGGTSFNARINAKNFSFEDMRSCASLAHRYGAKLYETLNIQIYDREIEQFIRDAYKAAECGVDAFIVADMGAADLLYKYIPEIPLHASTQMSIHNADGAKMAEGMHFTRIVPARELSRENIRYLVENTSLEVEIFVHGALCVSHSGQCLFSSLVGGRSGNRGLCAQPCRLPYSCTQNMCKGNCKKTSGKYNDRSADGEKYPLSLKDMSLASHITDVIDLGVQSLKIEGRMKTPEYVNRVAKVYRRLLDERRNASAEDIRLLDEAFSREGFTDGYFTSDISKKMLGVRSDKNKQNTRALDPFTKIERRIPLDMSVTLRAGSPITLDIKKDDICVRVNGDKPDIALNAPMTENALRAQLSRLGNTQYRLGSLKCDIEDGLMYPLSRLNSLRRDGIALLEEEIERAQISALPNLRAMPKIELCAPNATRKDKKSARFVSRDQITELSRKYFDEIYLPLDRYSDIADGFIMPPVVLDSEKDAVMSLVDRAIELGAKLAVISNIGQINMLRDKGLTLISDYRFNVMNSRHVCVLEKMGIGESLLSPELTLPQIRDIGGNTAAVVYGRVPLMTLEKCVIRDMYGCDECHRHTGEDMLTLRDRRGYIFPVAREFKHRNIIYNSVPICMSDREDDLTRANVKNRHFIFSVEKCSDVDAVIRSYMSHEQMSGAVKRIKD